MSKRTRPWAETKCRHRRARDRATIRQVFIEEMLTAVWREVHRVVPLPGERFDVSLPAEQLRIYQQAGLIAPGALGPTLTFVK
jgi:hypothetical protein